MPIPRPKGELIFFPGVAARRPREAPAEALDAVVAGRVRLGRRTKQLTKRLQPGEIAIIDHLDVDRVSAEDLVACGVRAVVNCRPSTSGNYPNMGPLLIVRAGIPLLDAPGAPLFESLKDGQAVELRRNGSIVAGERTVARGEWQEPDAVLAQTERARAEIGDALEAFAVNTMEYVVEEKELLAGRLELPRFVTDFRDRPVLIVVRGVDHKRDLMALRPYVRDVRPVLVGVDGGADAILEAGFRPDMIVGDMDSAAEETLRCGAELVVHAYPDGRAPGRTTLDRLGLAHKVVPAPATSEDVAMLIAAEKGARLIVAVGTHFNLVEFLDKSRRGMASTFLTRLRVGEILVDAKGVSRLYHPRPGNIPVLATIAAGLLTLAIVVWTTPALHELADLLWLKVQVLLGLDI